MHTLHKLYYYNDYINIYVLYFVYQFIYFKYIYYIYIYICIHDERDYENIILKLL